MVEAPHQARAGRRQGVLAIVVAQSRDSRADLPRHLRPRVSRSIPRSFRAAHYWATVPVPHPRRPAAGRLPAQVEDEGKAKADDGPTTAQSQMQ